MGLESEAYIMNERIKQLRKALGLTQQEFAERVGIKRNAVANYETGRNEPIGSVVNLICNEYNVNPDWLRDGTGEMFIDPATFSLDEYAQANKLTKTEISIIRGFMELDPGVRSAIYDIFKKAFSSDQSAYDNAPDDPQELEKMFPPIGGNDAGANIG